jgi:Mrp family chromosome partitioning ATPase
MRGYVSMDRGRLTTFVGTPPRLLASIALVAAVAALVVSLAQPERFRASAELWFGRTTDVPSLVADAAGVPTVAEAQSVNVALATLDTVAARVGRRFRGAATVDDIERAVDVRFDRNSDLVTVTAEWGEPSRAALLANTFADEMVALRRETGRARIRETIDVVRARLRAASASASDGDAASTRDEISSLRTRVARLQLLEALQTGDVQRVHRAMPPRSASSPKLLSNAVLASLVVLIVGLSVLLFLARVGHRIRDEDDVAALIPASVLMRIPAGRVNAIGRRHQDPAFEEAFQLLSLHLQLMRPEGRSLVVTVTSATGGGGTTTVVSRLAHALASSGAEVVAVDCDLRSPGLGPVLEGGDDIAPDTVDHLPRVLSGAEAAAPGSASIGRKPLRRMLGRLRDEAEFVLLDAAPVSTFADASVVAAAADGVILVVDLDGIRRKDLLAARQQLANAGARILCIVINRAPESSPAFVPRTRARAGPEPEGHLGPPTFTA